MTKGLPYIIDALFGKTELKDVSLEELHELVKEFGAGRVTIVLVRGASHAVIVEDPRAVADAVIAFARKLFA